MKKWIVAGMAVVILVIAACHKKAVPTVADRTEQPPPPLKPVGGVATEADLTAGKTIYETKCTRCHAAKPVDTYTPERWTGILKSMVPKARLDSMQTAQVTAYVNTHAKKS
jgi:uncharacterized membrane protein